jgi:hypothetical protein
VVYSNIYFIYIKIAQTTIFINTKFIIFKMETKKSNVLGIIGLCTGWFMPLAGLVLGVISLARKEPIKALGVLSIVEALFFWVLWFLIIWSL